ncbi:hypothetical protein V2I01_25470 [Micromonospora sp. BRA006-A]|nr:hypothetical protein [Micromonospora sp. BRA006-A]
MRLLGGGIVVRVLGGTGFLQGDGCIDLGFGDDVGDEEGRETGDEPGQQPVNEKSARGHQGSVREPAAGITKRPQRR